MAKIISYVEKDCFIHRLSGLTKLIFFLLWTITSMLTYDTRVLAAMLVISIICFKLSKTDWKQVRSIFIFILVYIIYICISIFIFIIYIKAPNIF